MTCVVWVDGWQMQCCGDPFRVGSSISWNLEPADRDWLTSVLGEQTAVTVDYAEEHHNDAVGSAATEAKVITITAVHCRYAPIPDGDPRTMYPVEGSAVLSPLESANGWTPDQDGLDFVGYLVKLAIE